MKATQYIPKDESSQIHMLKKDWRCGMRFYIPTLRSGGPLKFLRPEIKYQLIAIAAKPTKTTDASVVSWV